MSLQKIWLVPNHSQQILLLKLQLNNKLFPTISLTFKIKQVKMEKHENVKNHFVEPILQITKIRLYFNIKTIRF
jgi:hypothetical protein